MTTAPGFRRRTIHLLTEAQNALNIAFGAILSAYIGNSLAEIDNGPFDHATLAKFFVALGVFILGLCVGNALLLRGERRLGVLLLMLGAAAALVAHHEGALLGFEVVVLRILATCWGVALLASDLVLTIVLRLHHRTTG
ncbi:MAG: hypothetical protein ABW173_02085 [Sphingomonas sp.]